MKVVGISFSHAENSLQTRGLQLLNDCSIKEITGIGINTDQLMSNVYDMTDFNMPVCYSNKSDGNVPESVEKFISVLEEADILVFAISEATSHYSAGFKNAMDWMVVKSKFNAKLGTDYAITRKPIFVVTFTPTKKEPNGARHFDMTKQLLEKLGGEVIKSHVVNDAWKTVIPGRTSTVYELFNDIIAFLSFYMPDAPSTHEKDDKSSLRWLNDYNDWDRKWKYEWKPIHKVNNMPWPRIPTEITDSDNEVPLKEDYKLRSMDYLDTPEARPIFDRQADIIIENNIKGIVDVGCRIGIINDILHERGYTDYKYMGFDTSPQPISYVQEVWKDYDNIEYRCASMYNEKDIKVNFDVDCVIWSGVLLYDPDNHMELFKRLTVDMYDAKHAIIQEPCKEQDPKKFLKNMKLQTIEDDLELYAGTYTDYDEWTVDADVFSGRRKIAHVWI